MGIFPNDWLRAEWKMEKNCTAPAGFMDDDG